jgi:hypothetical protein
MNDPAAKGGFGDYGADRFDDRASRQRSHGSSSLFAAGPVRAPAPTRQIRVAIKQGVRA